MCEVVVIRSAGLVVPNSWVFLFLKKSQVFTPCWSITAPWRHVYYYILLLRWLWDRPVSPRLCRWCVKLYRKVVRSAPAPCVQGLSVSPSQWFFTRLDFQPLAAWLKKKKSLRVCDTSLGPSVRGRITWRTAWCPGRRPVGGGSRSRCWASASPRTSWRWRRRQTPFGRTCWGTGNGSAVYLRERCADSRH